MGQERCSGRVRRHDAANFDQGIPRCAATSRDRSRHGVAEKTVSRPRSQLVEKAEVVAAGPMLNQLAALDSPDMDERPGHGLTRRLDALEQGHGRRTVDTVQRHMMGDEVVVGEEMMGFDGRLAEVVDDRCEDRFQTLPALGSGGVVDEVLGDKLLQRRRVLPRHPLYDVQGRFHRLYLARRSRSREAIDQPQPHHNQQCPAA